MTFKDIIRQNGKWCNFVELMVNKVGEPLGNVQIVEATDSAGVTELISVEFKYEETIMEQEFEGYQSAFDIRWKDDQFKGFTTEAKPPVPIGKQDDYWERVHLITTRRDLMAAEISKFGVKAVNDTTIDKIRALAELIVREKS